MTVLDPSCADVPLGYPALERGTLAIPAEQTIATGQLAIAPIYGSEHVVGKAMRKAAVLREELLPTTKFWNSSSRPEEALSAFDRTVDRHGSKRSLSTCCAGDCLPARTTLSPGRH